MTRPIDPEIDLDAFLDAMEQGGFASRGDADSRRRVERYMELKQLNEELRDFAWDAPEPSQHRIRRYS
jgi:hypothetical protein